MEHFLRIKRILDSYERDVKNERLDQLTVEMLSNDRALAHLRSLWPQDNLETYKTWVEETLFVRMDHIETYDELLAWLISYAAEEEQKAKGPRGEWKEKVIHFWYATLARTLALELLLGKELS